MISDALKIAKLNAKTQRHTDDVKLVTELSHNPVVEILLGTLIVEAVHNAGIWNDAQRDIGGKAVIGAVVVQQLAPTLPSLFMAGSQLLSTGLKAIPAIAGATAGIGGVL